MKRMIKDKKEVTILKSPNKYIKVGDKFIVGTKNFYEEVEGNGRKSRNSKKVPEWFQDFVDKIFLPTIAEIKQDIIEIKERLDRNKIF
ncbi:MAG: hypothetical protein LBH55_00555 [Mycoplasmataceae bacterium]|nr:hypothetical protein [Mycoplasmataceae bacterium]